MPVMQIMQFMQSKNVDESSHAKNSGLNFSFMSVSKLLFRELCLVVKKSRRKLRHFVLNTDFPPDSLSVKVLAGA